MSAAFLYNCTVNWGQEAEKMIFCSASVILMVPHLPGSPE